MAELVCGIAKRVRKGTVGVLTVACSDAMWVILWGFVGYCRIDLGHSYTIYERVQWGAQRQCCEVLSG